MSDPCLSCGLHDRCVHALGGFSNPHTQCAEKKQERDTGFPPRDVCEGTRYRQLVFRNKGVRNEN